MYVRVCAHPCDYVYVEVYKCENMCKCVCVRECTHMGRSVAESEHKNVLRVLE